AVASSSGTRSGCADVRRLECGTRAARNRAVGRRDQGLPRAGGLCASRKQPGGIMNDAIRRPKTTRHLEYARQIARGEVPGPPVAELIGFNVVEVDVGRSVLDMHASRRHANPMGTLHGGILCDLADAAMGVALSSTLED